MYMLLRTVIYLHSGHTFPAATFVVQTGGCSIGRSLQFANEIRSCGPIFMLITTLCKAILPKGVVWILFSQQCKPSGYIHEPNYYRSDLCGAVSGFSIQLYWSILEEPFCRIPPTSNC